MSTQPESAPAEGAPAARHLWPMRDVAVLALLGATGVMLFVAVIRLIPSVDGDTMFTRAQLSFEQFVNLETIGLPLLAVLLATLVRPEHPRAKLITTLALGEYAVIAVFGVLFGFLIGLIDIASFSVRSAFEALLLRGAWLAVFGIAAFAVFQVWRNLYRTPRPAPGMYGQPAYDTQLYGGQPYGQPSSNPQPYGQPSSNPQPYGERQYGPSPTGPQQYPQPGSQQYPQPGSQQYGQPSWNQHSAPQHPSAQHSAPPSQPPGPFAPQPGHPQGPAPYGSGPYGGAPHDEQDRTRALDPGAGPDLR